MAAGDMALRVLITASAGNALSSISQLATSLGSGGLVGAFLAVGAAAAGAAITIGVTAVQAASDFQSSLAKVQAYAGYTKAETEAMGNSILQMAPQLGEAPKALADSLYMVASAGFKGANSLDILRYAGMTAAAANTDAATVTKDLVSSLSALGLGADQAGNIMDELNSTVKNGLLTWDSYGSVVGKLAGAVSTAGGGAKLMQSNFQSLNAALDVYTNGGISAHQASMWLSADMSLLDGKTATLTKNAAKLGISFDATKFASMNFGQQLQYLNTITDGNRQKLVALLGGNSTVANSIQYLNNHYKQFSGTLSSITSGMQKGQTTQSMFAVAQQTLAFQAQKAQAAFQSLMITIGNALLPAISHIVASVTPVIAAFAAWVEKSHIVQNVVSALGTVFNTVKTIMTPVIGVFMQFMGVLGQVINWVQHNQTAMTAFKYVLIAIGAIIAGFLIVSLIAVAVVIAAVAIVIGVIIGIIMGVIWVVQHWGDIMHWFGGIFSAIGTFIHGVIVNIGNAFSAFGTNVHNIITNIGNGIGNFFSGLGTAVHNGIMAVVNFFVTGFQTIGGWFTWLYNHNYIIQAICDFIRNVFQAVIAWLQNAWQTVVSWLTNIWNTLKTAASIAWGAVSAVVMAVVNAIGNWLHNIWTTTTQWLGNQWNSLKGLATTAWNNVTSAFQNAWNGISGALKGLWNNISNWFSNLGNQALQWGKNVIQQLINGINSMLGALGNAVANAASKIAGALGFHSPTKEGPGHDSDKWAPAFVNMFASGIIAGIPKITSASYQLSNAMNSALGLGSSNFAVNGGSFALQGRTTVVVQPGQAAPVYLDKREVGQILFNYQASELRKQSAIRNR